MAMNFVKTRPLSHLLEGLALLVATPFLLFPTPLPLLTSLVLLFLALAWFWQWRETGQPFPRTPLNTILLVWGVMLIPATLVSADMDLTLPKLTGLILGLAAWRFMALSIHDDRGLRWGMVVLGVVGLMFVLFGLISADWVTEVGLVAQIFGRLPERLLTWPGLAGDGVNTNQLGGILVLWPVILWGELVGTQRNSWELVGTQGNSGELRTRNSKLETRNSVLLLITFIVTLVLLLLTQSRSSWLGAAAGLVAFCWLWSGLTWSRRKWWRVWGAAAILLILLALILLTQLDPRQMEFFVGEIPGISQVEGPFTLDTRQEIWHWGLMAVGDFPLTGVGLGSWRRVGYRLYPFALPIDYDFSHAHNIFLQVALDVGLPGLVAYVAMVGLVGWLGWQVAKRDAGLRPRIIGLLSALIALHTYGLLDALAPGSKPGLLFWLILGWLAAAYQVHSLKQSG